VLFVALAGCRRRTTAHADSGRRDRGAPALAIDAEAEEGPLGEPFGPPNPWGDGSLPPSTARGPEADATLRAMTALRASIGFWRIERSLRDRCPTLDDLEHTAGAAFDPATMRNDAWGSPFEIECQGARVRVRSLGPDRVRETPDDLWTM
jgi:hypothetical protein